MDEIILTKNTAIQHSQRLQSYIKQQIAASNGQITFAEYMHHSLYAPGLGYYTAGSPKFGKQGDFITAPEIGSLFAQCVAEQIAEVLALCHGDTILELGAGSGQLACDLLTSLDAQNIQLKNYYILELSADLRLRQQEKILNTCPQFAHLVKWLDHLPAAFNGVIFANEVMDAMPVAKFHYENDLLQEYYVALQNDYFIYKLDTPTTELNTFFTQNNIAAYISQPYISEINLLLSAWIKSLSNCLTVGAILLCDYGFPRAEYYHPHRNQGTFMCHYQHHAHADPFINIGLQDLTAHVDFTAVAEAAVANDLAIAGFTNLASFLLNCAITKFLAEPNIQQTQEVNILTSPAEMGELFKCIALTKSIENELLGFKQFDKAHSL